MLEEGFKFGAGLTPLDFSALGSSRNHHVHASEEPRAIAACGHAERVQDRACVLRHVNAFDILELAMSGRLKDRIQLAAGTRGV